MPAVVPVVRTACDHRREGVIISNYHQQLATTMPLWRYPSKCIFLVGYAKGSPSNDDLPLTLVGPLLFNDSIYNGSLHGSF